MAARKTLRNASKCLVHLKSCCSLEAGNEQRERANSEFPRLTAEPRSGKSSDKNPCSSKPEPVEVAKTTGRAQLLSIRCAASSRSAECAPLQAVRPFKTITPTQWCLRLMGAQSKTFQKSSSPARCHLVLGAAIGKGCDCFQSFKKDSHDPDGV